MEKINFENLPLTNTPINAENLNNLQDNVKNAIPAVIDNLESDSATDALSAKQGKLLKETKQDKIEDTGWQTLTLNTQWNNLGGNYMIAQYRKIGNHVFLRGLVKNDTSNTSITIATLPEGFRPQKTMYGFVNISFEVL